MIPGIVNSSSTETLRVTASWRLSNFLGVLFRAETQTKKTWHLTVELRFELTVALNETSWHKLDYYRTHNASLTLALR